MSDDLQISGGAGGLTAKFDDMRRFAGLVDTSADTLREAGLATAAVTASADLAEAAILCPVEVAEAEAALAWATGGPSGSVTTSTEMEVMARLVRGSIDAYQFTDAQLAHLAELGWDAAGFTLGFVGVPLAIGGVTALALTNPVLFAQLVSSGYVNRDQILADAQQTLWDDPWLEESLTRMAPGLVEGTAFALLGPFAPVVSGGSWPTTDYASAVAGLINAGSLFGAFQDDGTFHVDQVRDSSHPLDLSSDQFVHEIFDQQGKLGTDDAQVQIIAVRHPGQATSYIVQIPGTQDWSPVRTDNPVDLTTNVWLESARDTQMQKAVADAMAAAEVPSDAPVMLTGHSQGGITAAALTTDQAFMDRYHVTSVVTGGSPIGRVAIPATVSVLSVEHAQDVVPKLDGADNPDRPNWVTVTRDLSDAEGESSDGTLSVGNAHLTGAYATTGHGIDVSVSESIERWRADNAQFFSYGNTATATRYQITRDQP